MIRLKHYMDIQRIKEPSDEVLVTNTEAFEVGDHIIIQEKWDGCFSYNARITLADGSKIPIGKIVNQKLDVEVLSYNFETRTLEPSKILNYYNHGKKKPFIEIKYRSHIGSNKCRIFCTEDHLFYTNIGWIPANKLHSGLTLFIPNLSISEEQKQLVLGTMLGDSSLYPVLKNTVDKNIGRNYGIVYTHSNKQLEYAQFKNSILGNLFRKTEKITTGYDSDATRNSSICTMCIDHEVKKCLNEFNKKEVNVKWLKDITSIGLAFWYMDDGSLLVGANNQRPRATFHTEGFSKDENDILLEMLYIKFGITGNKTFYKDKYYKIDLSADGSERLFSMIAPYVINSMSYKLPDSYRKNCGHYWDNYNYISKECLTPYYIDMVDLNPSLDSNFGSLNNYDIETENHNYFVGDFLVHNSNASCCLDENGNLVAFSRKNELDYKNTLRGFWNYIQSLDKNLFADLGNMIIFGEWAVAHTVKYYADSYNKWYVYDLYDKDTEEYLPQDKVKAFAESHGLDYINTLYDGPFKSWLHCKTFLNSPAYGDNQEGIVVKNQSKLNSPDVRQPFYLKIVNDSFAETKAHNHRQKVEDPQRLAEQRVAQDQAELVVTEARVRKDINKMIDEGILPEQLSAQDMKIIAQNLPKRIFDDVMKEEGVLVDISNQFLGKAISGTAMKFARKIILG